MQQCVQKLFKRWFITLLPLLLMGFLNFAYADETTSIDRIQLVTQQINLLKTRHLQAKYELSKIQEEHDREASHVLVKDISKKWLNKIGLDITVSKTNLESINIELSDAEQNSARLEKNIQEIENQLNVLNIFGLKVARNEIANLQEMRFDLKYQKKLLVLEKIRVDLLKGLQTTALNFLRLRQDQFNRLSTELKSRKMLHLKQQQVKDELVYQQQQNHWLQELAGLNAKLEKVNPSLSKKEYVSLERQIFIANENAYYAYIQSLITRYRDELQQMKAVVSRTNSLSLLNDINGQMQTLTKQLTRLDDVLKTRIDLIEKHKLIFLHKTNMNEDTKVYIHMLGLIAHQYQTSVHVLSNLKKDMVSFRFTLDQALKSELSSRQGFPNFGTKMLVDLGRELLLIPTLTFQVVKNLSAIFLHAFYSAGMVTWSMFVFFELIVMSIFIFLRNVLLKKSTYPSEWNNKINFKWLGLQWIKRNFADFIIIINIVSVLFLIGVPIQHFAFVAYLALVWIVTKGIITLSRLCLVETTHDAEGHDVVLFKRLKWTFLVGGMVTALTVFIHQLPLVYELKILFVRLFLVFLLVVSLLLLKSREVVPNFILSHMESQHPYLKKSIYVVSILVPLLLLFNSVMGLLGFVNLVLSIAWYQGIFLMVLIGYLILRGLLSKGMEHLSRLLIQYSNNGWLLTEAFIKPLDKVLRVILFLSSWAILFLLYRFDQQSPIVERFMRLLHYRLMTILNTAITPLSIIELGITIAIFYWIARWIREFVYRFLFSRTKDMGVRNSIAILSQYFTVIVAIFICLNLLGIDWKALTVVSSMLAFGIGLGLRDLANNFASGFLILLERPLRVGDIITIKDYEGEVLHIGGRAVTLKTWDHMEVLVPNAEIFNSSFTNWTAKDNIVRCVIGIKITRHDNPHEVKVIIQNVLAEHKEVLKDPSPEVYLKQMSEALMEFELRYFVNIRQIKSRTSVTSAVLLSVWDAFIEHGIKPPYPQHEIRVLENGE